ncbi:hypothetical protein Dalu01_02486 [Deinococcus aluminii]|uniref:Intein C-terminal splicing domain-containing protein n=2 Tax=Deinococcus aluminii TaxID=1656885 RepID=A0ABP9XFE0_9DEIO
MVAEVYGVGATRGLACPQDPEQGNKLVQMVSEHPYYVKEWSATGKRPKPVGHEDLNEHWVGAGHLKVGDKIKQADGTTGVVANVVTLQQTREMFNLTVSEAHTFYVGQDGWLVHNQNGPACGVAQLQRLKAEYAAVDISDAVPFLLKKGGLSQKAIQSSTRIMEGSDLGNPAVIKVLTKDGSNIADWGKYSITTKNGEIHYYYNPVTKQADYSIDFKIKYSDGRVVPLPGR